MAKSRMFPVSLHIRKCLKMCDIIYASDESYIMNVLEHCVFTGT